MDKQGRSLVITLCLISLGLLAMVVSPFLCFIGWKIALVVFLVSLVEVIAFTMGWILIITLWKNTDQFNQNAK